MTAREKRFVLLDRDGTIIVEKNYLLDPAGVELVPGAIEALRILKETGLGLVLVTNQSPIGRGLLGPEGLEEIHGRLGDLLSAGAVSLDGIYHCPHTPGEGCGCRKPETGLAERAAAELGFDLSRSFVIGDKAADIEMGRRIGAVTFLVRTGHGAEEEKDGGGWPDFVAGNILEAAALIAEILKGGDAGEGEAACGTEAAEKGERLRRHLLGSVAVKRLVLERCLEEIIAAAEAMISSIEAGGKILLCGNGGSAADCQHLAGEFVNVLRRDAPRPPLPALALTTDTSVLTACANDFGFEGVFERQVAALASPGDVLLALSTSGGSQNVLRAMAAAAAAGMRTIALTGGPGGIMAREADIAVRVPSLNVQHIQEAHITIGHILCDLVEGALSNSASRSA